MNVCTNIEILRLIAFFLKIIDLVKIAIPIGLIVMAIMDIAKNVISSEEKEQKKNINLLLKRFVFAGLVFFVPTIVEFVMVTTGNIGDGENFTDCIENARNIKYYNQLNKENNNNNINNSNNNNNNINSSNSATINISGQKYNLTDSQLRSIAMVCQKEQGSAVGAAAEASLMANRFELYGSKYGVGANGLYNYVRNSGWFSNSKKAMDDTSKLKDSILSAVKDVLVNGKRTLPLYVDEHDCIDCGSHGFDIVKIILGDQTITDEDGLLDKSNYVSNETVLHNRYGAVYTFYSFPTKNSDPFGYTNKALKKYNEMNK